MKVDILICLVGGQNIKPYLDFFYKYAKLKGEKIYVDYQQGFSKERCTELYSIRIGGGFGQIIEGNADVVISLEQLEAVKTRFYPKEDGGLVVSTKRILPSSVLNGTSEYPKDCMQKCINDCFKVFDFTDDPFDACFLALRLIGETKQNCQKMFCDVENFADYIASAFDKKYVKA